MIRSYEPAEIEPRWQARWRENATFEIDRPERPKVYILEMLPYPSGRLHVGHVRNYAMGDVVARFHRMRGRSVLHPIGWDSLGLPAENAAIERGADPREWTVANIATMREQLRELGLAYDWSREIASHEPEYYRWNQWFFLRFLEAGLAYRKKRGVHWCEGCRTVLANEQVEQGRCYRCDTAVVVRELEQWFLRTTAFQEELLEALDELDGWPESTRTQQRNWIGRSRGARVTFRVADDGPDGPDVGAGGTPGGGAGSTPGGGAGGTAIDVFTTRIDTIHGCTFLVVAPDHPVLESFDLPEEIRAQLAELADEAARSHVSERGEERDRRGVATGVDAVHPYTGERIPIWAGNFVVAEYGTGAVMAVPAHDLRDRDFALRHGLPIVPVIIPPGGQAPEEAFTDDGTLADSGSCSGMSSAEAREALTAEGEREGFARAETLWRLRDWGISRQRFWGTPIPIVHCDACGIVPVPDEQLPVLLPERVELTGEASPLARHPDFAETACPACEGPARRESDTMDTFVDSAWYFFRYLSPNETSAPVTETAMADWMPIDLYLGGQEHAVTHLIYCRWWARAMRELGLGAPAEPVTRMVHHGMVTHPTLSCPTHGWRYPDEVEGWKGPDSPSEPTCRECGEAVVVGASTKMSKSLRNTIQPDEYRARYGADTLRLFSLFTAPPGKELEWSDSAVEGTWRFLNRAWRLVMRPGLAEADASAACRTPEGEALETKRHQTIAKVTTDIEERLHLNTGIAAIMELCNAIQATAPVDEDAIADPGPVRRAVESVVLLLAPYAPHFAEECWAHLGGEGLATDAAWPEADPARLVEDTVTLAVQVNGKRRGEITVARDASREDVEQAARADETVARHLGDVELVKLVHVPNRLVNFVVRPS